MKITLPTDQIKEFLSFAQSVKTDDRIINKYIKFEIIFGSCILIKNNFKGFCRYSFFTNQQDCVFLVPEDKLIGACSITSSKEIIFTLEKDKLIISPNESTDYKCNVKGINLSDFPFTKEPNNKNITRIEKTVIDLLIEARAYADKDDLVPQWSSIYLDENAIYSSNRFSFYFKLLSTSYPKIIISPKELDMISSLDYVDYSIIDNHNIYSYGNITYGYIQSESSGIPIRSLVGQLNKSNYIKIKLSDLVSFCKYTIAFVSKSKKDRDFEHSSLSMNNSNSATLSYEDTQMDESNKFDLKIIETIGESFNFKFLHTIWLPLISVLGYEEICIGNESSHGSISIWNDKDESYIGVLPKTNA